MAAVSSGSSLHRKVPSGEQRPRTGQAHPAITQADLDNTARLVLQQAEEAAEETAVEALEKRMAAIEAQRTRAREETRASVRWWLEMVKTVVALLVGSGIVFAARCDLPAKQSDHQRLQQVLAAPAKAGAPDANVGR